MSQANPPNASEARRKLSVVLCVLIYFFLIIVALCIPVLHANLIHVRGGNQKLTVTDQELFDTLKSLSQIGWIIAGVLVGAGIWIWFRPARAVSITATLGAFLLALTTIYGCFLALLLGSELRSSASLGETRVIKVSVPKSALSYEDFVKMIPFFDCISKANSFVLYEGIPRFQPDGETQEQGIESKSTIEMDGSQFYEKACRFPVDGIPELRRLCTSVDALAPYLGVSAKTCGGFHPDFCLVWQAGEKTCRVLICFGCGEVVFSLDHQRVSVDLSEEGERNFHAILDACQSERPASEGK